ncbi:cytochrome P450 [Salmonirosea aquatica]|uniref:Cytochrome P450 n=1 Tax=Salmonirosea aquatica TaxID=2654236 RepID=A0A7C9BD77_9BACT|nr:cytochrome P450 [Cytophagaceae bacterium SJW1-29]
MATSIVPTLTTVPHHRGWPLVGSTYPFISDPLGFMLRLQEQYERLATVKVLGRTLNIVQTAEDAKYILQENNRNYHKSEAYRILAIFLGNGLLTSEEDFWRRQRKLAQPAFYKQRLALMTDMMAWETELLVADWKTHDPTQPRDISKDMLGLTLNIVTKALFSTDVGDRVAGISDALNGIMHFADNTLKSFIRVPLKYPTPGNVQFLRAVQKVEEVIYGIINGRREQWKQDPDLRYDDLLDMLMRTRDEETGETMSDGQLRDEVTTIFMAGHETTANALSWALYLLARYPEVAHKIREESTEVLAQKDKSTFEKARELRYTLQVVQEVMRLYPPAWVISRRSLAEDQIGPYAFPTDSYFLISPYTLHRRPEYWQEPEAFNPDRFTEGNAKDRPTYAYLPFGGGPRLCIGNNFALLEMQLVLAILLRDFEVSLLSPDQVVEPEPMVTLRPKGSVTLKLKKVKG